MKFVGVDLHKETITVCVVNEARKVLKLVPSLSCINTREILRVFRWLGPFEVTVEATAGYEWLVRLIEPLAQRVVLAHPKKLRIIAESTNKNDKVDARILAQFLACGMIPPAYRPTPRQRDHRRLVRHRHFIQGRITSTKNKIRRVLADYNADIHDLFTHVGRAYLEERVCLSNPDRFVVEQLVRELDFHKVQLQQMDQKLERFAEQASAVESRDRELLRTIPRFGKVTIDVVLAELADARRFSSQKKAVAYAGLAPGQRESAGKRRDLSISKQGSGLLRWALIQAAWRLVTYAPEWKPGYDALQRRRGKRRAIVAVARRLLCVVVAMLKSGQPYRPPTAQDVLSVSA